MLTRCYDLLLLTAIVVFIVDLSGFTQAWKPFLQRFIKARWGITIASFHPFDCSLCASFWVGVVYLCVTGWSLPLFAVVCGCSLLAAQVRYAVQAVLDLITGVTNMINRLIDRL